MTKLEKVKNTLERCELYGYCADEKCPYYKYACCLELLRDDVLSLIKTQEPRVMTREELSALPFDTPVFIEENNDECGWNVFCCIDEENDVCFCGFKASADYYDLEEYGESWRCWTARPTDEQREATPWSEPQKEEEDEN